MIHGPKNITLEFDGIPGDIDAAFLTDSLAFFVKGVCLLDLLLYINKTCFTLIVRPFDLAFLSWVTERRGFEADRRQFHTESHLT